VERVARDYVNLYRDINGVDVGRLYTPATHERFHSKNPGPELKDIGVTLVERLTNVSATLIGAVFCGLDSDLNPRSEEIEALCLRQCYGMASKEAGFKKAVRALEQDNTTKARTRDFVSVFENYDADIWSRYTQAGNALKNCIAIRWHKMAEENGKFRKLKKEVGSYLRLEGIDDMSLYFQDEDFFNFLRDPLPELKIYKTRERKKPVKRYFSSRSYYAAFTESFSLRRRSKTDFYSFPSICRAMKQCYDKIHIGFKRAINVTASPSCKNTELVWPEAEAYLRKRDADVKKAEMERVATMTMDQESAIAKFNKDDAFTFDDGSVRQLHDVDTTRR
jgi:hypothetical protein